MEKATKNQETVMRELSREELAAINGGTTFELILVDGKLILIKVN